MKISRRLFIKNTGVFVSATCIPLSSGILFKKNFIKDKNVKVGGHPWVYAAKLPNYDITPVLETIFQDMKYAQLDGVELMHHPLRVHQSVNVLKDLIDKYELPVIGTSYGADMWDKIKHQSILDDVNRILDNLAAIKGRTMGISVGNTVKMKTENQLDSQAELLVRINNLANEKNIVINLHNHTYEVENNMHDLRGTLKRIPDIKLGPDINWLIRAGVDPIQFISEFGDKIIFMHLRDQNTNGQWTESLGEGDTDFNAIGKALNKAKFAGDLVIELAFENNFEPTRPLRDSLLDSRKYIKKEMDY